jgi:hypothetical protein
MTHSPLATFAVAQGLGIRGGITTMATKSAPTEVRKLNMDEKRKLEKVLLADIQTVESAYEKDRAAKRDDVKDAALTHAPREAKELLKKYPAARRNASALHDQIASLGYNVGTYGDGKDALEIHYNWSPKIVRDFDAETARVEKNLRWLRLSEQIFRVAKWSLCRG